MAVELISDEQVEHKFLWPVQSFKMQAQGESACSASPSQLPMQQCA